MSPSLCVLMKHVADRLLVSNILNPEPEHIPPVDPRDAFMLVDAPSLTNGSGPTTPVTPQVSWLRRTEYISGVTSNRTQNSARES